VSSALRRWRRCEQSSAPNGDRIKLHYPAAQGERQAEATVPAAATNPASTSQKVALSLHGTAPAYPSLRLRLGQ
jgi:hypothetical protein